jgi:nitrate/nitrite-specific signal transduction histidine kinase
MSLRIRLILATSAVVLVLFGLSEWLSYAHTTALLDQHEAILIETSDHAAALERLRQTRSSLLWSATTVRVLNAALTLLISVAVLNYVWYRVIYRPIRRLLGQINIMGRGTWTSDLPIHRDDEIGRLTAAFNDLGRQLTSTFQSIHTSSRLSALALVGHRLMREVTEARVELTAAAESLRAARRQDHAVSAALATLNVVNSRLERLETQFQDDFNHEVVEASAAPFIGPAAETDSRNYPNV